MLLSYRILIIGEKQVKRFYSCMLFLFAGFFLFIGQGQAITIYDNEVDFLNALSSYQMITFDDRFPGANHLPVTGNEYNDFGVTFTATGRNLFIEDGIAADFNNLLYHDSGFLSINEEPFTAGGDNNDSLEITLTSYAFGVTLVNSAITNVNEQIVITYQTGSDIITSFPTDPNNFFGVVTTAVEGPITSINFIEAANDSDDIGYDNIILGNTSTVPEPTTAILFSVGILGLAGISRKKPR